MSDPYHTITLQHDPDNPEAVALVDRIYALLISECHAISTSWANGIEEHRFLIAG